MSQQDKERERRSSVYLRARVETATGGVDCRVSNISEHGMCIEHDRLVANGERLAFVIGGRPVGGVVAWANDRLAGIRFDQAFDLATTRRSAATATTTTTAAPRPATSGWLAERPDSYRSASAFRAFR